jgi:hypothetical protein
MCLYLPNASRTHCGQALAGITSVGFWIMYRKETLELTLYVPFKPFHMHPERRWTNAVSCVLCAIGISFCYYTIRLSWELVQLGAASTIAFEQLLSCRQTKLAPSGHASVTSAPRAMRGVRRSACNGPKHIADSASVANQSLTRCVRDDVAFSASLMSKWCASHLSLQCRTWTIY